MGVVDDGDEHLARAMDFEGFLDEEAFAAVIANLCRRLPTCRSCKKR